MRISSGSRRRKSHARGGACKRSRAWAFPSRSIRCRRCWRRGGNRLEALLHFEELLLAQPQSQVLMSCGRVVGPQFLLFGDGDIHRMHLIAVQFLVELEGHTAAAAKLILASVRRDPAYVSQAAVLAKVQPA